MVMVEIDSNAILFEPMKSREDEEMIRTYNSLLLRLKCAGIIPKKHVLDNEVSENMKNHIRDTCKFEIELVPPGCHQRNAAEVAIHNFKAHFLSVLAGIANNFPQSLWDWLLPQTEIRINLIQQLPPQMCWHNMPTSDVRPRCMRRPTNAAHGRIIW
jgi:hypothetical protein